MNNTDQSVVTDDQSVKTTTEEVKPQKSPEELVERLRSVSAEAQKYRLDRASLKAEKESLEAQLEEIKKQSLESQGNYKGLYEKLKDESEKAKEQFQTQVGKYALNVIQSTVKEQLVAAKCQRPDAILKLSGDKIRGFDLDENFLPNSAEVKALVEEAQKDFPEWFKVETPKFQDGSPMGKVPTKSVESLTPTEIMAQLRAMDNKRS